MLRHVVDHAATDKDRGGGSNPPGLPLPLIVAGTETEEGENDAQLGDHDRGENREEPHVEEHEVHL